MLKNLKSLFIIEEEPRQKAAAAEQPGDKPADTAKKGVPRQPSPRPQADRSGQVTQEFTEVLLQAMDRANLDKFDYLEFKNALNNLKKVEVDEGKRYRSAYALAQTMGATPEQLIETAEHYQAALATEEKAFESALAGQMERRVSSRVEKLSAIEKAIADKEARMQQLQKEVEQHRQDIAATQQEVDAAKAKMDATKQDFMASYQNLVRQIRTDVENIRKYLTGQGS
jgi:chromosome segregation ATPase